MLKWVTTNIGIKLLSLLTAGLLWFHVVTERSYEKSLLIPIQYVNLGNQLLITHHQPPKYAKIKIRGNGKELLRFGKGIKILLDLKEVKLGWKRIDLTKDDVDLPPDSKITVTSITAPKSFIIRVDEKAQKIVKIIPTLKSDIKIIYNLEVVPKAIEIFGGRSVISLISKITTEEIAPPAELPATLKVKLIIPDDVETSVDSATVVLKSS
jgi:hypothetical protein